MLRALVPLEEAVKKIHVRREEEGRKNGLEMELISAHADQARQVRFIGLELTERSLSNFSNCSRCNMNSIKGRRIKIILR